MFWVLLISLSVACAATCPQPAETTVPCCSLEFGNTDGCLDVPRELCCELNASVPEAYKSSSCLAPNPPCARTCGNGLVEPWEECDGGENCTSECKSEIGKCCYYGEVELQSPLPREDCVPGEAPMYWERDPEAECPAEAPDRAFCRRENACCKCGVSLTTKKGTSDSLLGPILFWIAWFFILTVLVATLSYRLLFRDSNI